jgi:hypothetical protein
MSEPNPNPNPNSISNPTPDKTFTQAELDAKIEERLARERKKYEGFDDLKAKAAKLDEIEKANLSESEKLKKELEDAKKAGTERITKAEQRLLKAEVKAVCSELGIVDPDIAYSLIQGKEGVKVNDDDSIAGVKEALTALLESKPYLKGQAPGGVGNGSNPGEGNNNASTLEKQLEDDKKAGNFALQVALRRQITEQQQKK